MNPQLRMLVWKEWRERRGQLVLCLSLAAVCLVAAAVWSIVQAMRNQRLDRFPWELLGWIYCLLMPVLLAMQTACGELTDRTQQFSLSLPASPRRASLVRLIGGGLVLILPIVVVAVLASLARLAAWQLGAPVSAELAILVPADWSRLGVVWASAALLVAGTLGCYLQLAVLGTFVRSENQAALLGAVWTILWAFVVVVTSNHPTSVSYALACVSPHALSVFALAANPSSPQFETDRLVAALVLNANVSILLAALFVWRHSQRIQEEARLSPRLRLRGWLAGRSSVWRFRLLGRIGATRWSALAWLAMRQSLPLCLAAIVISLVLCPLMFWFKPVGSIPDKDWPAFASLSATITMAIGILWASVVGVGSVADELDRRSGDFWRTRPIPFWGLFTIKFVVGMVVVVLVLDGPMALVNGFDLVPRGLWGGRTQTWLYIACLLPLHAAMFAIALAWACSLRRLALAAMAALACFLVTFLAGIAFTWLEWLNPFAVYHALEKDLGNGRVPDFWAAGYPSMVAVFLLATVASYIIAGFALAVYQPRGRLR